PRRDSSVARTRRTSPAVPRRDVDLREEEAREEELADPRRADGRAPVAPAAPAAPVARAAPALPAAASPEVEVAEPRRASGRGARALFLLRSTNSATDRRSVVLRAREVVSLLRRFDSAMLRRLTNSLEVILVDLCLARYERNTAIVPQIITVMASCGKTASSGYAEVTRIVVEKSGEPSAAVARETNHDVIKMAMLKSRGMDATVK